MKLISKKSKYQNIITCACSEYSLRTEFTRRNTFNVRIAMAFIELFHQLRARQKLFPTMQTFRLVTYSILLWAGLVKRQVLTIKG